MTHIIKNRNAEPAGIGSVLDQLFPKSATTLLGGSLWGLTSPAIPPVPVNIREIRNAYELELAAPGLCKSDFQLKIEGDTLTIAFGKQDRRHHQTSSIEPSSDQIKDNAHARWVRRGFTPRPFEHHFELGDTIDRDKISARYDNGILLLTLPKKENFAPDPRQINVG